MPGNEVNHRNGKSSEDQGNDTEIPFWFCKGVKLMGEDEEKGRMKESWVFFIEFQLTAEIIPRILEGINFVKPKGFPVEGVES